MNKKFFILMAASLLFFVALVIVFSVLWSETRITSTSLGKNQKVSSLIDVVEFVFSRDAGEYFDESSFNFEGMTKTGDLSGNMDLDKEEIVKGTFSYEGKRLVYRIDKDTPLVPSSSYKISFKLKNFFGKSVENTLEFTTDDVGFGELNKTQQKLLLSTIDAFHDGRVIGHEITKYLPYENDKFRLVYNYNEAKNNVFYTAYYKITWKDEAIREVEAWIKSKGGEPSKLNIEYLIYP